MGLYPVEYVEDHVETVDKPELRYTKGELRSEYHAGLMLILQKHFGSMKSVAPLDDDLMNLYDYIIRKHEETK